MKSKIHLYEYTYEYALISWMANCILPILLSHNNWSYHQIDKKEITLLKFGFFPAWQPRCWILLTKSSSINWVHRVDWIDRVVVNWVIIDRVVRSCPSCTVLSSWCTAVLLHYSPVTSETYSICTEKLSTVFTRESNPICIWASWVTACVK